MCGWCHTEVRNVDHVALCRRLDESQRPAADPPERPEKSINERYRRQIDSLAEWIIETSSPTQVPDREYQQIWQSMKDQLLEEIRMAASEVVYLPISNQNIERLAIAVRDYDMMVKRHEHDT